MSLNVPRIDAGTAFTLRPWRMDDLGLVREASVDEYIPLVTSIPSVYSESAGRLFIERQWGRAAEGSGYPFVIVRVEDERPVGAIGLWTKDLDQGRASIGYWVVDSARGQGAASAALAAVAGWGLRDLGVHRLELCVEPWNTASIRTAERAGFQREGVLRGWQRVGDEYRDMFIYSLLEADL